jgi:two-component system, OmpR family, sensor histidine kinase KdpD
VSVRIDWNGIAVSVALVAAVTGVVFALREAAPVVSLGSLYVFAVLPVAIRYGLAYALGASVLSMLAFNFFFLPPVHSLSLRDSENWVVLAVYLLIAVAVSELASRARRRAADAEQQRAEAAFAADVSALLLECRFVQDRLRQIGARLADVLRVKRAHIEIGSLRRPDPGERMLELEVGPRKVGRVFLDAAAGPDPSATGRVLATLASLLASAIDRERLAHAAIVAEGLRQSDEIKTAILRTLSHDLRSPLTGIATAAEVLEGGGDSLTAAERAELVASIRTGTRRLARLVSNLLDLSRLEAGAARPRPELWTVDAIVARALEAIGREAERVDVSLPAGLPALSLDAGQIERVLVNLLENALKVSSPADRVELATEVGEQELVLRISDHGPGLDPENAERLFEPFERGATGEGTGLGLAIARGFAQANGGRLWVESAPGEGATFAVAFPVAVSPVAAT